MLRWIMPATLVVLFLPPPCMADTPDGLAYFESKVRPLLIEHCVSCHGPAKQKSGLRLDSKAAFLKGGDSGPALVEGKPEASLVVEVVTYEGEVRMPPKGKLSGDPAAILAEWVRSGAPWTEGAVLTAKEQGEVSKTHWSFQPVKRVEPPKDVEVTSPIDAFVHAKLASAGLKPSKPADKRTLIRRAYFDLTGLPPAASEVDTFVADRSPEAFAKVVEQLLASPRYGERWARHWLDVARYADTKGYVFTEERRYPYAYTYRDWVINAFNADLPYDQFVLRQIAGDLVETNDEGRSLAALGYLTVGRRFLNNQQDIIDDRIDVVGRGFLGLTITCARCHDHKFDPIPTDDYYSLYGVFNSCNEPKEPPTIPANVPAEIAADYAGQAKILEGKLDTFRAKIRTEILGDLKAKLPQYLAAGVDLKFDEKAPKRDEVARAMGLRPETFRWIFPHWKNRLEKNGDDPTVQPWKAMSALPDDMFSSKVEETLKGLKSAEPRIVEALLKEKPPATLREAAERYGAILASDSQLFDPLTFPESESMRVYNRKDKDELTKLTSERDKLKATHAGSPPRAMVLVDNPTPNEPHVFLRGNPGRQGKQVPRRFLQLLSSTDRKPFTQGSGRKELGQAVASKDNPLTSRVMVNRVWAWHFGQGLVRTPSDFGLRGDAPTHPELLDYLASEFMASGWSLKALHRMIMNSQTYQQSSDATPELAESDPQNLLLARFNRQRLDFESLRDSVLMAAGKLDVNEVGGRPVELFEAPFATRRTIYGFIDRQNLPGTFRSFDFASPDASTPKRFVTTVPQQALFLMNSPFIIEQAIASAHLDGSTDAAQHLQSLHRQILGRSATPHQVDLGLKFLQAQAKLPPPADTPWIYGYGKFDVSAGKIVEFQPLTHWTGSAWQMSPSLPDPKFAYLNLTSEGGHPGNPSFPCVIRRWVAPCDGVINIDGRVQQPSKEGDGICARVVSSSAGELGTWVVHGSSIQARLRNVPVKAGEAIDFVLDPIANHNSNGFSWAPKLVLVAPTAGEGVASSWDAKTDFRGPGPAAIDPWEAYAQVLLLTNEFTFVD